MAQHQPPINVWRWLSLSKPPHRPPQPPRMAADGLDTPVYGGHSTDGYQHAIAPIT